MSTPLFPKPPPGGLRATPPAIFPPILGLLGLGLAWRRAGVSFGIGPELSDAILGAVTLLALFALFAYAAKALRRPGVVVEDLRILPGRAGLSAMTMAVMLLALVALSYAPGLALLLLWLGLALHVLTAGLILSVLVRGPAEQRRVTPVWHLSFVGFILAPLSAVPLGFPMLSAAIFSGTLGIAAVVWGVSALQLVRASVPAPLRPLLVIHLAPISLFATVAALMNWTLLAQLFGALAVAFTVVLVAATRWITAAGFSPLWGAFTFPMAALASAMLTLADLGGGAGWRIPGAVALIAASAAIPVIAGKILRLWAKRQLGPRTNAAVA